MQTITSIQASQELAGVRFFIPLDRVYGVVNHKYLVDVFIPWFRDWCFASGLHYKSEAADCDKFARAFACQAHFAAWRRQTPYTGAIGWFDTFEEKAHAANIARTDQGWYEIEPQTGGIVPLRDNRDSLYHVVL